MHHKILKVQMHQYLGFYSCDQNFKVVVENTFISCELDRLIEASPSSATVLDIITASGSCKEDSAEDIEAFKEVIINVDGKRHLRNTWTDIFTSIFHQRWRQPWQRRRRKLSAGRRPSLRRSLQSLPLLMMPSTTPLPTTSTKTLWTKALLLVSMVTIKAPKLARMSPPTPGKNT